VAPESGLRLPLLIRLPVRSGQVIYAENSDLIVLAPVNPGAELIADGNIHVYGALRGKAVAGAHGATEARIFCQRLEAELVGIDIVFLMRDQMPADRLGKPAQVLCEQGRCVIAPL
jgi:septum site-determining protein MinC